MDSWKRQTSITASLFKLRYEKKSQYLMKVFEENMRKFLDFNIIMSFSEFLVEFWSDVMVLRFHVRICMDESACSIPNRAITNVIFTELHFFFKIDNEEKRREETWIQNIEINTQTFH